MTPHDALSLPGRYPKKAVVTPGTPARILVWTIGSVIVVATAAAAWIRVGLLDLPHVPNNLTAVTTGLIDDPVGLRGLDRYIRGAPDPNRIARSYLVEKEGKHPGWFARQGVDFLYGIPNTALVADPKIGLQVLQEATTLEPDSLVIANVYRMEAFRIRRDFLDEARKRGEITPRFPEYLDKQPIKFFEELVREHPSRETKLSLALAWVDNMLLFPALEIKAPSSVQSVDILTEILNEPGNEYYVPALFARGLNQLHRPARLVWPESAKTPPDAAAQDIAKCVAIGRNLGVGSKHLQATLAMTLGDAYVKAGRFSLARSWWQIAQNMCHDNEIGQAILRRYAWRDEEMIDRLEEELDRSRSELEHPMTDLALMWN